LYKREKEKEEKGWEEGYVGILYDGGDDDDEYFEDDWEEFDAPGAHVVGHINGKSAKAPPGFYTRIQDPDDVKDIKEVVELDELVMSVDKIMLKHIHNPESDPMELMDQLRRLNITERSTQAEEDLGDLQRSDIKAAGEALIELGKIAMGKRVNRYDLQSKLLAVKITIAKLKNAGCQMPYALESAIRIAMGPLKRGEVTLEHFQNVLTMAWSEITRLRHQHEAWLEATQLNEAMSTLLRNEMSIEEFVLQLNASRDTVERLDQANVTLLGIQKLGLLTATVVSGERPKPNPVLLGMQKLGFLKRPEDSGETAEPESPNQIGEVDVNDPDLVRTARGTTSLAQRCPLAASGKSPRPPPRPQ
jgi:hypothetical protein